jgi:hemerythrin
VAAPAILLRKIASAWFWVSRLAAAHTCLSLSRGLHCPTRLRYDMVSGMDKGALPALMEENFVVWSDDYSVGSVLIDSQHKELAAMTNELFRSCEQTSGRMALFMRTIQRAVNYAKTHFATEEIFMRKVNYPDYIAHKKEHEDFVNEVLRQVKNFEAGTCAPIDFARFLKKWLLNHIAVCDKKYAPFLKGIRDEDFKPQ